MLGHIYALKDRGFDRGVKVGRDRNHPDRFKIAQCYSPRGLDLVAVWPIKAGFHSLAKAEQVARDGLPHFVRQNAGVEWRDLDAREGVEQISANLAVAPEQVGRNPKITSTYDDFRDPKHVDKGRYRQGLWVYQENETGLLKVQRTHSWEVPREAKKTYSLLGFRPIALFLHNATGDYRLGNQAIHEVWKRVVCGLGYGVDHIQVGWLKRDVKYAAVRDIVRTDGLVKYPGVDWRSAPVGMKPNR
jgi:hypothetical protein